jgi:hypothetical protein
LLALWLHHQVHISLTSLQGSESINKYLFWSLFNLIFFTDTLCWEIAHIW